MKSIIAVIGAVMLACVISTLGQDVTISGHGGGRTVDSPDMQFYANASSLREELSDGSFRLFYMLEVLRRPVDPTDPVVGYDLAQIRIDPLPGEPFLSFRSQTNVITWADDSSWVNFKFQRVDLTINTRESNKALQAIGAKARLQPER